MELVDNDGAIELTGRLDGRSSAEVRDALYDHIERHPDEDVRVDVTQVESIDVTALNLLAAAALKVRRAGGQVVLVRLLAGAAPRRGLPRLAPAVPAGARRLRVSRAPRGRLPV